MRDKLDKIGIQPAADSRRAAPAAAPAGADQDAVSALVVLGYRPPEASRMVSKVFEEGMDTEVDHQGGPAGHRQVVWYQPAWVLRDADGAENTD